MDALRRAEAEKKQAAKEKEEQQHQGDAGGPVFGIKKMIISSILTIASNTQEWADMIYHPTQSTCSLRSSI